MKKNDNENLQKKNKKNTHIYMYICILLNSFYPDFIFP